MTNENKETNDQSTEILPRFLELAVQSSNDTNSTSDRRSIEDEVEQIKSELTQIVDFEAPTVQTTTESKMTVDIIGGMDNVQSEVNQADNNNFQIFIAATVSDELF